MTTAQQKSRGVKPSPTSPAGEPETPNILSRLLDEAERRDAADRPPAPAPRTDPAPRRLFAFD
jgi:hypothetical protein